MALIRAQRHQLEDVPPPRVGRLRPDAVFPLFEVTIRVLALEDALMIDVVPGLEDVGESADVVADPFYRFIGEKLFFGIKVDATEC